MTAAASTQPHKAKKGSDKDTIMKLSILPQTYDAFFDHTLQALQKIFPLLQKQTNKQNKKQEKKKTNYIGTSSIKTKINHKDL